MVDKASKKELMESKLDSKKDKKTKEDEKFEEAFKALLDYHNGYTIDENTSYYCED